MQRITTKFGPITHSTICRRGTRYGQPYIGKRMSSYYVVLPELPQDTKETNPLLQNVGDTAPDFNVSAQQCFTGLGKAALEFESQFANLEKQIKEMKADNTFENTAAVLDRMHTDLLYTYGVARSVQLANDTPPMRSALFQGKRAVFRAAGAPYLSHEFYKAIKTIRKDAKNMNVFQMRLLDKLLLEGRLNGLELSVDEYAMYQSIMQRLGENAKRFAMNVEFATNQFWAPIHDPSVLDELPKHSLDAFDYTPPLVPTESPTTGEVTPTTSAPSEIMQPRPMEHRITLSPQSFQAIMGFSNDRLQRLNVWQAYVERAGFRVHDRSNSLIIEEIRQLRSQEAALFGYPNYAEYAMTNKMAGSLENVMQTLVNMIVPVKAVAQRDLAALQKFATTNGAEHDLELWDLAYWRRRQLETDFKHVAKGGAVKQFFPYPLVLDYLFDHVRSLFGYKIKDASSASSSTKRSAGQQAANTTWHPDARMYKLEDVNGRYIAKFIIDPYERSGKERSAVFEPLRNRCDVSKSHAIASLFFSFPSPKSADRPSMLSFEDVHELFRRFGTALQHMATDVPYAITNGISSIEWDAAALAGGFMRSWLLDADFVRNMTKSSRDGKQMPKDLALELVASNQHMVSLDVLTQLYYSVLDTALFSRREFWQELMRDVWEEVMPFKVNKDDAHPCGLSLIFCGGYSASYYTFMWGEMMAADVYEAFKEAQADPTKFQTLGPRYRDTFLAKLGSERASDLFRRFRGRDPTYDAFLKQHNLAGAVSERV